VSSPNQKSLTNPTQGLWDSGKLEGAPIPASEVGNPSSGALLDDWGDFQDFNSAGII